MPRAVPLEQRGADLGFQRLDALGNVGLHRVELLGGTGDATKLRATVEKVRRSVNSIANSVSILEIVAFSSIYFPRMLGPLSLEVQNRREAHAG